MMKANPERPYNELPDVMPKKYYREKVSIYLKELERHGILESEKVAKRLSSRTKGYITSEAGITCTK